LGVVFEKCVLLVPHSRTMLTVTDSASENERIFEVENSITLRNILYPKTAQKCQSTNQWSSRNDSPSRCR
jgi:hypothetical protein